MIRSFDWILLLCIIIITGIGMAMVYSASHTVNADPAFYLKRQAIALVISVVAFLVGMLLDYNFLQRFYKAIYLAMLILLVLVFFLGEESDMGGLRWIPLGSFNLQPSEVAKICLILSMAAYLDTYENTESFAPILKSLVFLVPPLLAVLKQPDLGTATVLIVITGSLFFLFGVPWRYLLTLLTSGLAMLPVLWLNINEDQKKRIYVFLDPFNNQHGDDAWQLLQSLVAIGAGGLWGNGYLKGSQTQLRFLPESHTDFIYSTVAEELGFVGAAGLIIVYLILIWRILSIAFSARDRYGRLVASSVAYLMLYHLLVNVGMTLGIMPITGIPLPMVSYAASNLLTVFFAMGVVLSIGLRRSKPMF